jgi:hypothetical protein
MAGYLKLERSRMRSQAKRKTLVLHGGFRHWLDIIKPVKSSFVENTT